MGFSRLSHTANARRSSAFNLSVVLGLVILLLDGCAAKLEDLQAMTAEGRADFVCESDSQFKVLKNRIEDAYASVTETEAVILQGYRLHQSCKQVPSVVPDKETCAIDVNDNRVCVQTSKTVINTVCEDIPVAIDGDLETKKLIQYQNTLSQYQSQANQQFDSCYRHVLPLNAQQAFDYYQKIK